MTADAPKQALPRARQKRSGRRRRTLHTKAPTAVCSRPFPAPFLPSPGLISWLQATQWCAAQKSTWSGWTPQATGCWTSWAAFSWVSVARGPREVFVGV